MTEVAGQRLQKALAHLGLASRRRWRAGYAPVRLTVNGQPATLGMRVVAADKVRLDGRLVRQRVGTAIKVFLVHRSPGVEMRELLQTLPRSGGRRFVAVSPMPAIDGGLELVTSDGETAERLQRGVRRLVMEFSIRVHGELSAEGLARVLQGTLDQGSVTVHSCDAAGGEGSNRWYSLVAVGASGKEIRQLFERQGAMVSRVLRTRLGPVTLDRSLPRGRSRLLGEEEASALMAALTATPESAAAEGAAPTAR